MHIDHKPGEEMFVDWAGTKMQFLDREPGEIQYAHLIVSTLGGSAYPYVEAFHQKILNNG